MNALPQAPARSRIKRVTHFDALLATPFEGDINALCWERTLPGDFGEIVDQLNVGEGITTIDDARLRSLTLSDAGRVARDVLWQDQERLRAHDLAPRLDCVNGYKHDRDADPMPTHVQSFHVDSATVQVDTWLCTYHGPASEGLPNEAAQRRVDAPETRARLLELYGGADDEGFLEFLAENFHDLHYRPMPTAQPFSFGAGNLWRIAVAYPGSPVLPCIHRAPATVPGESPRLLLIS